jgi:hypothetical protein
MLERRRAIKGERRPDARAQVPGQRAARGKAARSQGAQRARGSGSGPGRRSGMTPGPHLSATLGGGGDAGCNGPRGGLRSWAARAIKDLGHSAEQDELGRGMGKSVLG